MILPLEKNRAFIFLSAFLLIYFIGNIPKVLASDLRFGSPWGEDWGAVFARKSRFIARVVSISRCGQVKDRPNTRDDCQRWAIA